MINFTIKIQKYVHDYDCDVREINCQPKCTNTMTETSFCFLIKRLGNLGTIQQGRPQDFG